jgi:CheY-like chemotaxis protein
MDEATRNLRAGDFANAIVALTASAMKTDRERCLAAGCNDYLTKPVQPDELIELIGRYCTPNLESSQLPRWENQN